jgi:glycolate oxidase FAD binding subunit
MRDIKTSLQASVLHAYQTKQALKIVGAGTKNFLGRQTQGEVVDVSEHSGILQYQPVELVLTARAGTRVSEVQQTLAEQGQMLAFEPPIFGQSDNVKSATLGGTLAANLSGASRPWTGSMRDLVLGVELINGRGELLNFGGKVMKNVAGYDVSRTQAGAMGSLGLMTEISLKVLPTPEMSLHLSLDIDQSSGITLMNKLAGTPKPITGACWVGQKLHIRLAGAASSVETSAQQWQQDFGFILEQDSEMFWQQLSQYQNAFMQQNETLWRFSVNSTAAAFDLEGEMQLDWLGSQRWIGGEQDFNQLQFIAEQAGGSVCKWRGGDRELEVNHSQSNAMQQLQKRLKHSFDPHNILNPGRLYSWL